MRRHSVRLGLFALQSAFALLVASVALTAADAPDWSRFRGPNGVGISAATNVPTEFGPGKNLLWRLALPPGHSSPILLGDRIYLTGVPRRDARDDRDRSADAARFCGSARRRRSRPA